MRFFHLFLVGFLFAKCIFCMDKTETQKQNESEGAISEGSKPLSERQKLCLRALAEALIADSEYLGGRKSEEDSALHSNSAK